MVERQDSWQTRQARPCNNDGDRNASGEDRKKGEREKGREKVGEESAWRCSRKKSIFILNYVMS